MSSRSRKQCSPMKRRSTIGLNTSIHTDDTKLTPLGNEKRAKRKRTADDDIIQQSTPLGASRLVTPSSKRILRSALKSGSECMSTGCSVSFQETVHVREFSPYQKPTPQSLYEEEEIVRVPKLKFDDEDEDISRAPPLSSDEEDEEVLRVPPLSSVVEIARISPMSFEEDDDVLTRASHSSFSEVNIMTVPGEKIDGLDEVTEPLLKLHKDKEMMNKEISKKRRKRRPLTFKYREQKRKRIASRSSEKKKMKEDTASSLPQEVIKQLFLDHTNCTVSEDGMNVVMKFTDLFLDRVSEDIKTYSQHALRSTVTEKDCVLLLKRQRFINDSCSYDDLVQKYLTKEYAEELATD